MSDTGSGHATIGKWAVVGFSRYEDTLMELAERLFSQRDYGLAVLTAHTASEVAIGRTLASAFHSQKLTHLREPIEDLFVSFNLKNDKFREFFVALTGKAVKNQPFWSKFHESCGRRNGVVHEGKPVSEQEAKDALEAIKELLGFLQL